ncbi:MAG: hypothetical protein Q9209_005930 [Squamulea sp. 1 TL-2023]
MIEKDTKPDQKEGYYVAQDLSLDHYQGDLPGLEVWDVDAQSYYDAPPAEGASVVKLIISASNGLATVQLQRQPGCHHQVHRDVPRTAEGEKDAPISVEDYVRQKYKNVYGRLVNGFFHNNTSNIGNRAPYDRYPKWHKETFGASKLERDVEGVTTLVKRQKHEVGREADREDNRMDVKDNREIEKDDDVDRATLSGCTNDSGVRTRRQTREEAIDNLEDHE